MKQEKPQKHHFTSGQFAQSAALKTPQQCTSHVFSVEAYLPGCYCWKKWRENCLCEYKPTDTQSTSQQ